MSRSYSDIRESELDEYVDEIYRRLKHRDYEVRVSKSRNTFMCPFCDEKGEHEYVLQAILQHGREMGRDCKNSVKLRGKHLALHKYLDKYYRPRETSSPFEKVQEDDNGKGEKFVIPWKGIVANLPLELKDGRYVGESGSKLRDELTRKGYNPTKVIPLWGPHGHSGYAIVNFNNNGQGFVNALTFEKDFESNRHGKRDWRVSKFRDNELYGWMAREGDYRADDVVGRHLRDNGDVRSLTEIEVEETRKMRSLVSNLNQTLQDKAKQCQEMEVKYQETCGLLNKVATQTDKMTQQFNEEMERMWKQTIEDKEKILDDHINFKHELKAKEEELEQQEKTLERLEADYDNKLMKLRHQKKMNELATQQQKRSEQKVLELIGEHQREKEELHKKIIELEKQIDQRQALELQIEQLKGAAQVMEHMRRDDEMKKKMEEIKEELKEKEEELEFLDQTAQSLIVKEKNSNDELQEARKELINGLNERKNPHANIGVKVMGCLDVKVFKSIARKKYPKGEITSGAQKLISLCKGYIEDPHWYPFKYIGEGEQLKAVIDEEDEILKAVRSEHGDEVWQVLKTVMSELNEYNSSGRYPVDEIWHLKENRKARLGEAAEYLVNLLKNKKK